jgi:hypothetical protein
LIFVEEREEREESEGGREEEIRYEICKNMVSPSSSSFGSDMHFFLKTPPSSGCVF